MRASWILFTIYSALLVWGCSEQPQCLERGPAGRTTIEVVCTADKLAICGDNPDELYSATTGALLPIPPDSVENGSCAGITGPCRNRPVCGVTAGETPTCANGEMPLCRLGRIITIAEPGMDSGPPPDSGPPMDSGTGDSGTTDSGPVDGGGDGGVGTDSGADAAAVDSGPTDAAASDA